MLVFLARRVPLRLQRQSRSLRPLCRDVRATYSISMGSIWTGVPSYRGVGNMNIDGVVMLLNGCKKTDGRRQSVRRGPPKRAKAAPGSAGRTWLAGGACVMLRRSIGCRGPTAVRFSALELRKQQTVLGWQHHDGFSYSTNPPNPGSAGTLLIACLPLPSRIPIRT